MFFRLSRFGHDGPSGAAADPFRRIHRYCFSSSAALCLAARLASWRFTEFTPQYDHFQRSHVRFDSLLFEVLLSCPPYSNRQECRDGPAFTRQTSSFFRLFPHDSAVCRFPLTLIRGFHTRSSSHVTSRIRRAAVNHAFDRPRKPGCKQEIRLRQSDTGGYRCVLLFHLPVACADHVSFQRLNHWLEVNQVQ